MLISIGVGLLVLALALSHFPERPVVRRRKGLEMLAKKGRLIHIRETESEHEI